MHRYTLAIILCFCGGISPVLADNVDYEDTSNYQKYRHTPNEQHITPYSVSGTGQQDNAEGNVQNYAQPQQPQQRPMLPVPQAKNPYKPTANYDVSAGIETGYRTDNLKWNIASDPTGTQTPNILSELTWKKVGGIEASPHIDYTQSKGELKGLHMEASANVSATTSGKNQDSDYMGDNRTMEFSRSNNNANGGNAEGFSVGVGYAFDFSPDPKKTLARFTALVGYAEQQQNFVIRDGDQTLSTPGFTPPLGPFPGLDSSYTMDWSAPFIGADLTGYLADDHRLKISGRYYRASYTGEADWNLRGDFAHPTSFKHDADGNGFIIGLEYGWQFYPQVEFTLGANYDYFQTSSGTDTTFFSDGSTASTRLNKATWSSEQYLAGLNYLF